MASGRVWTAACALAAASCIVSLASAMPARRSPAPDLAAMRRNAAERNFIRFGRSQYQDMPDLGEEWQLPRAASLRQDGVMRRSMGDSFIRFGRAAARMPQRELEELLRAADEDNDRYEQAKRRDANFMRLGRRSDNFLRYGRSMEDNPGIGVNGGVNAAQKQPHLKKDSFLRLGRGGESLETSDGLNEMFDEEESGRVKCADCKN